MTLNETYITSLVALSIIIATLASFAAFGVSERAVIANKKSRKIAWLIFGSCSMGLGIWAMHFIGMLALQLPVTVTYDLLTTVVSIIPAIVASSLVLWTIIQRSPNYRRLLLNGALLGVGIGLMHHIGMSAMRMDAVMVHDKWPSVFSIIFAVVAATLSLKAQSTAAQFSNHKLFSKRKIISSIVMGSAISGMHYSAMAATHFFSENNEQAASGISTGGLAIMVSIVILVIISFSVFIPLLFRYRQVANELTQLIRKEKENADRLNAIINSSQDALVQMDNGGRIIAWSHQAEALFGWSEENVLGKELSEVIDPHAVKVDSLEEAALAVDLKELELGHIIEFDVAHRDGYRILVELVITRILVESGVEFNAFIRDISLRKRSEEVFRALAETSATGSEDIFRKIVRQLALSHNMRYATISVVDVNDSTQANTIAFWASDRFLDNASYPLSGTPCEKVIREGNSYFCPSNLQGLFSDALLPAELQAQSYFGVPLKDGHNNTIGVLSVFDDKVARDHFYTSSLLTTLATRASIELERKASEEKLKLFSRVFNDTHEGVFVTEVNGDISAVNPAFSAITGYSSEEVIGQNPRILSSGRQSSEFYLNLWSELKSTGSWRGEIWNRKKGGDIYAELLTISASNDEEGNVLNYVGIFSDITHSVEQQEKLTLMAHYDVLTQLPNRVLFADRFQQALAHSKRTESLLGVCFLDLDNFKPINDNYGHDVGDQLLIEVAGRIKKHIREGDTVSRLGGDEFTLLLAGLESFEQCEEILRRILDSLSQPYVIEEQSLAISASIGVTIFPLDDSDVDTLVRHADQAMYQAKLLGKNRYFLFSTEEDRQIIQKHNLLGEIRSALTNNELLLHYQPKVNMATGEVFGVEALIRWQHPEKGLIPPLDFLPAIEEHELEIEVGEWVIDSALAQLNEWIRQGITLEVSVNIASYHLLSASFVTNLERIMSNYPAVPANYLQLEILESSTLNEVTEIDNVIRSCQDLLGVSVALDDFGTGYSSLTHLRNLSAETVKIDRSFVRDILDDPSDYAIVDGVIGLADAFDRKVIAEGVESSEQGLMLLCMGCELVQGYAVSKPLPAGEFYEWFEDYTPNQSWINYKTEDVTPAGKKGQIFRLVCQQWKGQFEKAIKVPADCEPQWPTMDHSKCSCGLWLKREKHTQIFKGEQLQTFSEVHESFHEISDELKRVYVEEGSSSAVSGLGKFEEAFAEVEAVLNSLPN